MIYIYQLETLSKEMQQAFVMACDRSGETIAVLSEDDMDKSVAECLAAAKPLDMRTFTPLSTTSGEPFMLMDVDDLALDPFLASLRGYKVRINHKCMVTDKNKNWNIKKLMGDVAEEHAVMSRVMALHSRVKEAETLEKNDYPVLVWMAFERELDKARDMLAHVGKVEIPIAVVDMVKKSLDDVMLEMEKSRG